MAGVLVSRDGFLLNPIYINLNLEFESTQDLGRLICQKWNDE